MEVGEDGPGDVPAVLRLPIEVGGTVESCVGAVLAPLAGLGYPVLQAELVPTCRAHLYPCLPDVHTDTLSWHGLTYKEDTRSNRYHEKCIILLSN